MGSWYVGLIKVSYEMLVLLAESFGEFNMQPLKQNYSMAFMSFLTIMAEPSQCSIYVTHFSKIETIKKIFFPFPPKKCRDLTGQIDAELLLVLEQQEVPWTGDMNTGLQLAN